MTNKTQYVGIRFSDSSAAVYTYANDLLPAAVGDQAVVVARGKEVTKEIVSTSYEIPAFACKPVVNILRAGEGGGDQ